MLSNRDLDEVIEAGLGDLDYKYYTSVSHIRSYSLSDYADCCLAFNTTRTMHAKERTHRTPTSRIILLTITVSLCRPPLGLLIDEWETVNGYVNWNEKGIEHAVASNTPVLLTEYNSVACGGSSISHSVSNQGSP